MPPITTPQKLTLFGYGLTTKAIAKRFGPAIFFDDNVTQPFVDDAGNKIKPVSEFIPKYSQLEVMSPSIPPYHPLVKSAQNLMCEYDFFAKSMPYSIWISGTNGKTTTTRMIQTLLEDKGSECGGNIGTPLAELNPQAPLWILETSSYMLHYVKVAKPNIYILLPVAPDHLKWHGDFEAYEASKLAPLKFMQDGEAVILPRKYEDVPTRGFKILYDGVEDLAAYFDIDTSKLDFKGGFLLDAVLAMGVDKILYDRLDYKKINNFTLDAHRQERVYDTQGRLWINDSKATNIDATVAALDAFSETKLHLILGGDDKGVDLQPLFDALIPLHVSIYAIGANETRLMEMAQKNNVDAIASQTMANAMEMIDKVHTKESIALLSPAAASFDQFKAYTVRGDEFKKKAKTF